jgi:hypothetical protein
MQNRPAVLITTAMIASLTVNAADPQEGRVAANLSLARTAYAQGAPIELLLSITNRSPHPVWMDQSYPSFAGPGHHGVTVSQKEGWRFAKPAAGSPQEAAGVVMRRRLAAGETCSYKIYLQRFMPGPPVGEHSLEYSIDIPVETEDGRMVAASGDGSLDVGIFPAEESDLKDSLAAYVKELQVSDLTKSDFWLRRAAEEALAVTESPLVIPSLKTLFEIGSTHNDVSPLGKFRGNTDAENLLLSIIRKDKGYHLQSAIAVLQEWDYALSSADFAALCARDDMGFQYSLLQYAEKMNRASYLPAVAGLKDSKIPAVAAQAKRAQQALEANGQ